MPSTNNRAIDHLGFRVESTDINLQEACEYLMTNDVQIEIPVGKFGNFAFFKDPMNIWYELFPQIIRKEKEKESYKKKVNMYIYILI